MRGRSHGPGSVDRARQDAASSGPAAPSLTPGEAFVQVPCLLCGSRSRSLLFHKRGHFWHDGVTREHLFSFARCRECGLDYVTPRLRSDLLAHHYARHDLYVDLRGSQLEARRAYFGETLDSVEAAWSRLHPADDGLPLVGRRLLDVACSEGTFVGLALERGWDAEGIEISEPAAAHGRDVLKLPIRQGTLSDAGLPDAAYDVVTVQSFLEHSEEPVALLQEVARVLKPGGLLYANVCNGRSLAARVQKAAWYNYDPVVHLAYFGPASIRRLAREAGLEVLRTTSRGIGARFFQTAVADTGATRRLDDWYRDQGHRSSLLKGVKRAVSRALSAAGLGQTLILLARRPPEVTVSRPARAGRPAEA